MVFNNKFGMFIHFGLYSNLGIHEQALARYNLDKKEYENEINKFNPISFDPDKWVLLAKNAGMKYICITTKHHDGFCLWDTKYTDFNIMNSPFGKDLIKMLADSCHKYGILLSLYYSNPDWHHEYSYNPLSSHQWCANVKDNGDLSIYKEFIKKQITELLTNYGDIYSLFWDIPPKIYDPSINELVRKLQPNILINDRGFDTGDFSTPEREYQQVGGKRFSRLTEACNSLGQQSWGYRKNEDFYSLRHLMSAIDRIMSMGGSYLLNVGPNGNGEITKEYSSRLEKIGNWYNRLNKCLENNEEDTFEYESVHNECIINKKDDKSYFHFYNGLISNAVILKNYPKIPKKVILLNTNEELTANEEFLPEFCSPDVKEKKKYLHIKEIPVDDLYGEPIVLEIEW